MGFTVDSLLKLNSAKAYDKKTTVLQYVIKLLMRNDSDALHLANDLKSLDEVLFYFHFFSLFIVIITYFFFFSCRLQDIY